MGWLVIFLVAWAFWNGRQADRDLREIERLQRRFGCAESGPSPEPPSPHQLLGDIARPVPSEELRRRFAWIASPGW